jgi:RHS repeat-associated protein
MPNGASYAISYEAISGGTTGRVSQITYPNGGGASYSYSGGNSGINCNSGAVPTVTRTVKDNNGNTSKWTYTNSDNSSVAGNYTIIETDPANNQTVYNFSGALQTEVIPYQGGCVGYSGCNTGGTKVRDVTTCYNRNLNNGLSGCQTPSSVPGLPITQTDVYTWTGTTAGQSLVETTFDTYGNTDQVSQYDWGTPIPPSGTPLSTTTSTYNGVNGVSCGALPRAYMFDRLCSVIAAASGNTASQTTFTYNGTSRPTQISRLVSGTTYLTAQYAYNSNGTIKTFTDANNAITNYYYNGTGGCNNLLVTSILLPVNSLTPSQTWDCNGGVVTQISDANMNLTKYGYSNQNGIADPLWRLLSVTDPLLNVTWKTYSAVGTLPTTVETYLNFPISSPTSTVDTLYTLDGLGRAVESQRRTAPNSTAFDNTVQYTYGWTSVTGPFATQTIPGGTAVTTTQFDALGRKESLADGGGGTVSYTYVKNDVLQSRGPTPTFQKQLEYDGLGRLTSVCEITAGTSAWPGGSCAQSNALQGYWTKYTYDGLGDLLTVTQNAQSSSNQQTRIYAYDMLGRLTSETNPENGATGYTYDSDSVCGTSNGDLVKRVDAQGNVTCYAYDAMHRNTMVSYPSGPYSGRTPSKYFVYDGATVDGQSMGYTKGRLAEAYTGSPTSKTTDIGLTYSPRGEVTSTWESTPHSGGFYQPTAAYWANGSLQNLWISQIPSISYTPDGEGRMFKVSATSGQNPVTSASYNPASQATGVTFGSGDSDAFTFDPNTARMTQYKYNINGQAEIGNLQWNQNGTLGSLGITDPINSGDTQNCTYSHDDLIRIASANCGSVWGQTFAYDPFGNIDKSVTTTGIAWQPTYNIKNQYQSISGFTPSYDADGNLLADSFHNYTWDAEGKVSTIDSIAFTYDALRRNVEQSRSGTYYQVVYSPLGTKLGMFSGQTLQEGFVPLPGGAQAEYMSWGLSDYRHPDWLGSDRLESTTSHAIVSAAAYAPFGEPYAENGSYGDLSFTGANKDTLWLDYDFLYREYDPKQGRWISPDPAGRSAADPSNPKFWNRYAYVLNNPSSAIDPEGLDCVYTGTGGASLVLTGDCLDPGDNGVYYDGTVTSVKYNPNTQSFGVAFVTPDGTFGKGVLASDDEGNVLDVTDTPIYLGGCGPMDGCPPPPTPVPCQFNATRMSYCIAIGKVSPANNGAIVSQWRPKKSDHYVIGPPTPYKPSVLDCFTGPNDAVEKMSAHDLQIEHDPSPAAAGVVFQNGNRGDYPVVSPNTVEGMNGATVLFAGFVNWFGCIMNTF